jgi:GntR family transcriptional regulator
MHVASCKGERDLQSSAKNIQQFRAVKVDLNSPVPAYVQLEQDLRRQIRSGAQPFGSRLPPEQTLARLYGVSRVTLRQALQRLADAGLISRRRNIGTIITALPEVTLDLRPMESVTSQLRQAGYDTHVEILEQSMQLAPKETAAALQLDAGASAILVRRLLSAEGSPVALIASWLPPRLFPGLETALLSSAEDSLWSVLSTTYQRTPTQGKNVLEIVSGTVQESETLHVGFGSPLIKLICLISDSRGVPIEHSTALWITSKVRLHF